MAGTAAGGGEGLSADVERFAGAVIPDFHGVDAGADRGADDAVPEGGPLGAVPLGDAVGGNAGDVQESSADVERFAVAVIPDSAFEDDQGDAAAADRAANFGEFRAVPAGDVVESRAADVHVVAQDVEVLAAAVIEDGKSPDGAEEGVELGVHGVPIGPVPARQFGGARDAAGGVEVAADDQVAVKDGEGVGIPTLQAAPDGLPGGAVPASEFRGIGGAGAGEGSRWRRAVRRRRSRHRGQRRQRHIPPSCLDCPE